MEARRGEGGEGEDTKDGVRPHSQTPFRHDMKTPDDSPRNFCKSYRGREGKPGKHRIVVDRGNRLCAYPTVKTRTLSSL